MTIGRNRLSMPKLIAAAIQLATAKFLFRNSESGMRGSAWNRSQTMKTARSKTPPMMTPGIVIP